ncbi:hypothetical protein KXD40_001327 [Peronospora effusa]|nr:hypothetical protein KXD40_001327 [Peronospora effusa]
MSMPIECNADTNRVCPHRHCRSTRLDTLPSSTFNSPCGKKSVLLLMSPCERCTFCFYLGGNDSLLSSIMSDDNLTDKNKRTLSQLFQTSEVALVLGAALSSRKKDVVVETLLLITQSLTSLRSKQFHDLELAEAMVGYSQRAKDANDNLRSTICSLQVNAKVGQMTIEKLQTKLQQTLHFQDELKAQQDQAIKDIEVKFAEQIRQKEDAILKMRDAYEAKLRKIAVQCETMGQHMNKNINVLQHRETLLHESRIKRGILEDENNELNRKVQVLETRIDEVAQTRLIAMEEVKLRDKELDEVRKEIATIFGDYTAQRDELEAAAYDEAKRLENELSEQKLSTENTYKELVLLAKAHEALSYEKKTCENEMATVLDKVANLESLNITMQSQLLEKRKLADQLERKVRRILVYDRLGWLTYMSNYCQMAWLDDAATASKNALEVERKKHQAVGRDLGDLRKAHHKLESDMAMLEIQAAEQRMVIESKDEHLRKYKVEICHLTKEVGKQAKLQALIHQLSSGVDNNVKTSDGSSYPARDKETPPRMQMTSYLERWEEQKIQSCPQRSIAKAQHHHRIKEVENLSFISTVERETARQNHQDGDDDSFDLPPIDAFLTSEIAYKMQEKQKIQKDDEFMDAATFLKKNELGGNDSFSHDVDENWEHVNFNGRPSDFFERKSRNLDHVELSSPSNVDDPMFQDDVIVDETVMCTPQQQLSPTKIGQDVVFRDRFDRNSGLSGSSTGFSSGYEVHFDQARLMYTPNSLKYLQKKSRLQSDSTREDSKMSDHTIADHSGKAELVTRKDQRLPDQKIPEDPSSKYVATLQRGPGVIKEALHEIDALIDNSVRLASSPPTKKPHDVELSEYMSDLPRDHDRPLELMLPLSRTTDSWGEDTSTSQIDDDVRRRSRDLESLCSRIEPNGQIKNGERRSRSQEISELDTIREIPCPSNMDSPSEQSTDSCKSYSRARHARAHERQADNTMNSRAEANHCIDKRSSGETSRRSNFRTTLAAPDQSLVKVATTQNPSRDETHLSNADCVSDDERPADVISSSLMDNGDSTRNRYSGAQVNAQNQFKHSLSGDIDPNGVRFHYGENDHQSRGATRREHEDDQVQKSKTTAAPKQAVASRRLIDVPDLKTLRVAMDVAMIPRRCRRFLCSVGDVMTEQIVFTNVTKSVGRICVSVLPLSTGCQQFSVSPAVLELGPKTSSAFHITFNARYAGAVSGIFQFRGVGIESLFHPYEVVIEASVKRNLELEASSSSRRGQQHRQTEAINDRVKELQASSTVEQVAVTPTFIRFDCVRSKSGDKLFRKAKLCLVNNTAQALPFKVRAPENLCVSPAFATIPPASEISVSVLLMSQPLGQHRCRETRSANSSSRAEDWLSTLTVQVGKTYLREVSVVADWRVIQMLPPFDEIARSRHQLSSQTDSFYYTKRDKRRGLYFHARAVEFGCCNVGESHEVSVYVCNGSKAPMTVFLQDLQEPFSSAFSSTTIEPRKFIEVMVTFTPKVVGKVATSLFAYSLTDKAVVTLIARGT